MKAKAYPRRGTVKPIAMTHNEYARADPRYVSTTLCVSPSGKFYLKVLFGPDSFIGNGKTWKVERWPVSKEEAQFWVGGSRLHD